MKEKYYKYELDIKKMNILVLIAMIPIGIIMAVFSNFFSHTFDKFYMVFAGLMFVFVLHEVFHGIGYALFAKDKKKIKFGIALDKGVLYAMCQDEINKTGIIVSLIFPIIFLTIITGIIGVLVKDSVLVFLSMMNLVGAIGDIMMIILTLKLPKTIKYIDYNNDIGAYFISNEDISKIKTFGLKCTEVGEHTLNKVDNKIKSFLVTKGSIPYLIGFLLVILLDFVVSYFK